MKLLKLFKHQKKIQQILSSTIEGSEADKNKEWRELKTARRKSKWHQERASSKGWTQEEDEKLRMLKQKYGAKWSKIGDQMKTKHGGQCRKRWTDHINPEINKEQWTEAEQCRLFVGNKIFPGQWSKMTWMFKNRSGHHLKNHWRIQAMKKRIAEFQNLFMQVVIDNNLLDIIYKFDKK